MVPRKEKEFFALNYDRVFKAVFCSEEARKKGDSHLLERLIKEVTKEKIKVIKIIYPELSVTSTKERTKRLDLLIELHGKVVHMELNTSFSLENRIRNNCFFFGFCFQNAKVGEDFDTNTSFVHISLNYGMTKSEGLILSLKTKEDITKYAESVEDPDVKECAERLMILNENTIKSFWNLTPERENIMMQNTRENIIRKESEVRGINKEKLAVAKNLVEMNIGKDVIAAATGLSEEEIENLK